MSSSQASFPRTARLLRPAQFRAVFARGRKIVGRDFVVIVVENETSGARLGLAIAKRRARRAVDRSRIKRVVRESFRHVRHNLPPVDVVVLARSRVATRDNKALAAGLNGIWRDIADRAR